MTNKRPTKPNFPGGLSLEAWLRLPYPDRRELIWRAQCELLGCERLCASKACRRHRTCCGDQPFDCQQRLRRVSGPKPHAVWRALGKLEGFADWREPAPQPSES